MRVWLADSRKLLSMVAWGVALGCSDAGPSPTVHLSLQGQILSTDPTPVPVAGAKVALAYWDSIGTKAQVLADQDGRYQLAYSFSSSCLSGGTGYILVVTAQGYEQTSTLSYGGGSLFDPQIECTSDPQTINLSLHALGYLHLTTHTTGFDWDPDGYVPALTGKFESDRAETSVGYPMPVIGQQTIPLLPGTFKLELTDVVQNCTVVGDNPRTITVTARDTVASVFDVTCVAIQG